MKRRFKTLKNLSCSRLCEELDFFRKKGWRSKNDIEFKDGIYQVFIAKVEQ